MDREAQCNEAVYYADGASRVLPGDVVEMRVWAAFFRKRRGRVNYVPGISRRHSSMEFNGLRWVGIKFEDGMLVGSMVNPKTQCLKQAVRFLKRGAPDIEQLNPDTELEG